MVTFATVQALTLGSLPGMGGIAEYRLPPSSPNMETRP